MSSFEEEIISVGQWGKAKGHLLDERYDTKTSSLSFSVHDFIIKKAYKNLCFLNIVTRRLTFKTCMFPALFSHKNSLGAKFYHAYSLTNVCFIEKNI